MEHHNPHFKSTKEAVLVLLDEELSKLNSYLCWALC